MSIMKGIHAQKCVFQTCLTLMSNCFLARNRLGDLLLNIGVNPFGISDRNGRYKMIKAHWLTLGAQVRSFPLHTSVLGSLRVQRCVARKRFAPMYPTMSGGIVFCQA